MHVELARSLMEPTRVMNRIVWIFYFGLGSDLILEFLRPGLIGLKEANSVFGLEIKSMR